MKEFPAKYLCMYLVSEAFTKSDQKSVGQYFENFISSEAVDYARNEKAQQLDLIFETFKTCEKEYQLKSIIKKIDIPLKYFMFEKLIVTITFLTDTNLDVFAVEETETLGESLSQFLQSNWESIVETALAHNDSPTSFVKSCLDKYGQ